MTISTVTIAPRFNGPPTSGNGGYVAGLLMRDIAGAAEASLRAPPPLGVPLSLHRDEQKITLRDGGTLIGEAKPATLDLVAPAAPSLADARDASTRYPGFGHAFQTCFVCGCLREPGDGMRVFAGPVAGRENMVACAWTPSADLGDDNGLVAPEFIAAALDCPGYWVIPGAGPVIAVLARYTLSIDKPPPRIGQELIVAAWHLSSDGRKHRAASALYDGAGDVIARAEALWIEIKI